MVHPGSSSRRSFLTSRRATGRMIPPRGFKAELYPLQHKIKYSFGLSAATATMNTAICPLVMGSTDVDVDPETIQVNPHNTNYEEDNGPLCRQMSIIDKLRLSIRFNMTENCMTGETASGVFADSLTHLRFLWRPIFFSFPEKLTAADDDTGLTVATTLALTSDDTNEDVVALTTNKLPTGGVLELGQPVSTVNAVQVFGDYNYTTDMTMEDHVWDEDAFQNVLRRGTNKGALKACLGRTRWVNLTSNKPFQNFYIAQFVPRAIRRIVDRTYFAIQVHVPISSDISQDYHANVITGSKAHLGVKIICNYHEWNAEHDQDMTP